MSWQALDQAFLGDDERLGQGRRGVSGPFGECPGFLRKRFFSIAAILKFLPTIRGVVVVIIFCDLRQFSTKKIGVFSFLQNRC
jgi:hypothetical protein